jgi:hypothetical protein
VVGCSRAEVNHLPSFRCDTATDKNVKERLVADTAAMLHVRAGDREQCVTASSSSSSLSSRAARSGSCVFISSFARLLFSRAAARRGSDRYET